MQVRIDAGDNVEGRGALARRVEGEVEASFGRFGGRLMRAEVHLGDESADKAGAADKRRSTEARRCGLGRHRASLARFTCRCRSVLP